MTDSIIYSESHMSVSALSLSQAGGKPADRIAASPLHWPLSTLGIKILKLHNDVFDFCFYMPTEAERTLKSLIGIH